MIIYNLISYHYYYIFIITFIIFENYYILETTSYVTIENQIQMKHNHRECEIEQGKNEKNLNNVQMKKIQETKVQPMQKSRGQKLQLSPLVWLP